MVQRCRPYAHPDRRGREALQGPRADADVVQAESVELRDNICARFTAASKHNHRLRPTDRTEFHLTLHYATSARPTRLRPEIISSEASHRRLASISSSTGEPRSATVPSIQNSPEMRSTCGPAASSTTVAAPWAADLVNNRVSEYQRRRFHVCRLGSSNECALPASTPLAATPRTARRRANSFTYNRIAVVD